MPYFRLLIGLCLASFLSIPLAGFNSNITDSLLVTLDHTIKNQQDYINRKQSRINDFKRELTANTGLLKRFEIYDNLWFEYSSFQFDSAFMYASEMLRIAGLMKDESKAAKARLSLAFIFRSSGMFKEAIDTLQTIKSSKLEGEAAILYYESLGRTYYDLSFFNGVEFLAHRYGSLGNMYIDSAILLCPPNTLQFSRLKGLKAEANGRSREAAYLFHQVIDEFQADDHQKAMAYYSLGQINRSLGMDRDYLNMTIKSVIMDLRSATKETVASLELARYMYENGNIELASLYINQASEDAEFYGARQRVIQVSALMPLIESTKLINANDRSRKLLGYLILVSVLSVLLIAFITITLIQFKKLNLTKRNLSLVNEKLLEANTIKEEYVGFSFAKDSEYLAKLEKFKKTIGSKIAEAKYDDLKYVLNQFDIERETERLNSQFDEIFLRLFPNFVTVFNSLFDEEHQFKLTDKDPLPTELRIFALIRIGITEHEQIASILGYSVRTIYNYKNKIKGLSKFTGEEFEARLMSIRTFE